MIGNTIHSLKFLNAQDMVFLGDEEVDLVVSSPPYPMISMWDDLFSSFNSDIGDAISLSLGDLAFELMHRELDKVWSECYRVLKFGGIACINIGDATRKLGNDFKLYVNHSRVLQSFDNLGFDALPLIIWRKPSNSPNKFMGSGMLPVSAYVTNEHEYILVFRKGSARDFAKGSARDFAKGSTRFRRRESAIFWEERNIWFSDLWCLRGVRQSLLSSKTRSRSASYPLELPYRLINMYSIKGDLVLDPFLGLGTTVSASMLSERNSIGIDIDSDISSEILSNVNNLRNFSSTYVTDRFNRHIDFVKKREQEKSRGMKHINKLHSFPVVSKQEVDIRLNYIKDIIFLDNFLMEVSYEGAGDVAMPL